MNPGPIEIVLEVAGAFERLGVRYLIGGSMASSAHGLARSTMDVDVVAELEPGQIDALADLLGGGWHADRVAMREAARSRRSFNLLHLETMFKVDVFVMPDAPWERSQMARREALRIGAAEQDVAYFAAVEDVILAKLRWYRMGGEVSDRQWRDVLGVLALQAGRIDQDYLARWARSLQIADLLERALAQTGGSGDAGA